MNWFKIVCWNLKLVKKCNLSMRCSVLLCLFLTCFTLEVKHYNITLTFAWNWHYWHTNHISHNERKYLIIHSAPTLILCFSTSLMKYKSNWKSKKSWGAMNKVCLSFCFQHFSEEFIFIINTYSCILVLTVFKCNILWTKSCTVKKTWWTMLNQSSL